MLFFHALCWFIYTSFVYFKYYLASSTVLLLFFYSYSMFTFLLKMKGQYSYHILSSTYHYKFSQCLLVCLSVWRSLLPLTGENLGMFGAM